jgi:hypothetical protein
MTKIIFLLSILVLSPQRMFTCETREQIQQIASKSDLIALGEVIEVESMPICIWSGLLLSTQSVRYKVKVAIKGDLLKSEIVVRHYLVYGSLTATANKDDCGLSPILFKRGNDLLLFIQIDKKVDPSGNRIYIGIDENCGAMIANASTMKIIREIISAK